MALMMCSFVFAQSGNTQQNQVTAQMQVKEQNQEQARNMIHTGLETALTQVTNSQARTSLERNIESFQEKVQERLHRLEDIEITKVDDETGEVQIQAKERVKFLNMFKLKLNKQFKVDEQGRLIEQTKWYHKFFKGETI